jgi:hypothetical protein
VDVLCRWLTETQVARIMEADTDFENGLELLSCCHEFVDRCRVFEHFVQTLFDRIVEVRSLVICYDIQY